MKISLEEKQKVVNKIRGKYNDFIESAKKSTIHNVDYGMSSPDFNKLRTIKNLKIVHDYQSDLIFLSETSSLVIHFDLLPESGVRNIILPTHSDLTLQTGESNEEEDNSTLSESFLEAIRNFVIDYYDEKFLEAVNLANNPGSVKKQERALRVASLSGFYVDGLMVETYKAIDNHIIIWKKKREYKVEAEKILNDITRKYLSDRLYRYDRFDVDATNVADIKLDCTSRSSGYKCVNLGHELINKVNDEYLRVDGDMTRFDSDIFDQVKAEIKKMLNRDKFFINSLERDRSDRLIDLEDKIKKQYAKYNVNI